MLNDKKDQISSSKEKKKTILKCRRKEILNFLKPINFYFK